MAIIQRLIATTAKHLTYNVMRVAAAKYTEDVQGADRL